MRKRSLWTGVLGAAMALTMALTMVAGPASAVQETKIGVTSASNLTTTGFPPVSPEHLLEIGVEVVGDERVVTTTDGRAQLLFLDHSALTIGPNSNLVLDKFVYDPDAGVGELAFSATKGLFRLIGGRISKKTPVTISTSAGTIGIRGGIAIVSIEEGGPVEATFLFGKDMKVCTDTLPERERPRHERPGEQCFADNRGKLPKGPQQSSTGTERCKCVTVTRPGSLVTISSPGNVSAPVVLTAEQIGATVQQLEQPPGEVTDSAVLVFQQEVKDAALGALAEPAGGVLLAEPAAGPSPAPPPPTDTSIDTGDIISDSTEDTTSEEIAASPPPPPPPPGAIDLSGRVKRAADPFGVFGTDDDNPLANIPFAGAPATVGGVFDIDLGFLTLPFLQGNFPAIFINSPFTGGTLSGLGFLTADQDFVFYQLEDSGDFRRVLVWAGVPTPAAAFPPGGATVYELQPDFVLGSNVPFISSVPTQSAGGLTVPNPIEAIIDWDLGLFAGAAIVIDGQGINQQSAASVFFGPLIDVGDPQFVDILGQVRGGSFISANDTTVIINANSNFRLSRDGDGAFGNVFFGSTNPDYFVLERDGIFREVVTLEGVSSFSRDYSPNVIALAIPGVLGPRTTRVLTGFAGGLSRRFNGPTLLGEFMFQNSVPIPGAIGFLTTATTGTLIAIFAVQEIGAAGNDNLLLASFGGAGRSAFFDDDAFGAHESIALSQFTTVPLGPAVTASDLYLVTSEAFQSSNNFTPPGVTICNCQFLEWGFWGGEIRFAGGESERIHLANWVAGDNIAINLPTVGTATYNGHLIGTVLNAGNVYQAMGGFEMNFDFAAPFDPVRTNINVTSFDSVDYNAGVTSLTNSIYQATGADASNLGRSINFTGVFYGGGGDPVAETGGQFNIGGGPNYSASGIFAGAK